MRTWKLKDNLSTAFGFAFPFLNITVGEELQLPVVCNSGYRVVGGPGGHSRIFYFRNRLKF